MAVKENKEEFKRMSDWLDIEHEEITDEMKEYTECKEDWWQPCFEYNGKRYWLSDFIRTHNNPCGGMKTPDYIHGYYWKDYYNPIFIEIHDSGDAVRVYEKVN